VPRRTFKRVEGYTERDLIHSALDHLGSAKALFTIDPGCFDSAGYLSQLGLELLLKSLLLHRINEFPDSHSLQTLLKRAAAVGPDVTLDPTDRDTIDLLERFSTLRYPNPNAPVTIGDHQWEDINRLVTNIIKQMPSELQGYADNLDPSSKGGRFLMAKPKEDV
jgi:HEPN domain-containing protein